MSNTRMVEIAGMLAVGVRRMSGAKGDVVVLVNVSPSPKGMDNVAREMMLWHVVLNAAMLTNVSELVRKTRNVVNMRLLTVCV